MCGLIVYGLKRDYHSLVAKAPSGALVCMCWLVLLVRTDHLFLSWCKVRVHRLPLPRGQGPLWWGAPLGLSDAIHIPTQCHIFPPPQASAWCVLCFEALAKLEAEGLYNVNIHNFHTN